MGEGQGGDGFTGLRGEASGTVELNVGQGQGLGTELGSEWLFLGLHGLRLGPCGSAGPGGAHYHLLQHPQRRPWRPGEEKGLAYGHIEPEWSWDQAGSQHPPCLVRGQLCVQVFGF